MIMHTGRFVQDLRQAKEIEKSLAEQRVQRAKRNLLEITRLKFDAERELKQADEHLAQMQQTNRSTLIS
jgi:hypothetical protein